MHRATLACRCGALRGAVDGIAPNESSHAVCYCDDCQAFARWLGIDGVTDEHGGTEIVAVAQGRVRWQDGAHQLRCVRLSGKGMHRWYTACCRTPVGNTISAKVPFVGLPRICIADLPDGAVAPAIGVQGRFAPGGVPPGVHRRAPIGLVARSAWLLLRWWVTGKGRPSEYFDAKTGTPRSEPLVLTPDARAQLNASSPAADRTRC
jgi:hypothetical protein